MKMLSSKKIVNNNYKFIYCLKPVEFKTLKIYIKNNQVNDFNEASKFSAKVSIILVQNSNRNFCLYVNYCSLNNLIIRNWYSLLLIKKSFHQLGQAKRFIYLNLTSTYHQIKIQKDNE